MWHLFQLSARFGKRPSEFVFRHSLQGDLLAYQFDRAVCLFGIRTENRYDERDEKTGKRVRTLEEAMMPDGGANIADLDLPDDEKLILIRLMLGG